LNSGEDRVTSFQTADFFSFQGPNSQKLMINLSKT
jgi:hypothetical protein